jgi:cystathionine gamma-synthase/methionine-gamma-lyase
MTNEQRFFTEVVHAGGDHPAAGGRPIAPSIDPAVTYTYDDMSDLSGALHDGVGYSYLRYGSPTVSALETAVAELEGAEEAVAYATGMAALHAALVQANITPDRPLIAAQNVYGATFSLLRKMFVPGQSVHFVEITDRGAVQAAIERLHPCAIFLESMSNPLLQIPDLPLIAQWAHAAGASVIVDATFVTPYVMQPIIHGADVVVHSATKYLGGHGDVMGGLIATSAARASELRLQLRLYGGNLGPFEAWLILRGVRTLALRMREQCANAQHVAQWLSKQSSIAKVIYPGQADHPNHATAKQLFRKDCFGGMVTFELRDADEATVFRFMEALKMIRCATSLGDVYSLLLYPAQSSHHALGREERLRQGIGDGLVRLSCGIESAEDIVADLQQALGVTGHAATLSDDE